VINKTKSIVILHKEQQKRQDAEMMQKASLRRAIAQGALRFAQSPTPEIVGFADVA